MIVGKRLLVESSVGIGECAVRCGHSELARRHLDFALKQVDTQKRPKIFRTAHYWLARLCERERDFAQAAKHYEAIAAVSSDYRDIQRRLKHLFTITWS